MPQCRLGKSSRANHTEDVDVSGSTCNASSLSRIPSSSSLSSVSHYEDKVEGVPFSTCSEDLHQLMHQSTDNTAHSTIRSLLFHQRFSHLQFRPYRSSRTTPFTPFQFISLQININIRTFNKQKKYFDDDDDKHNSNHSSDEKKRLLSVICATVPILLCFFAVIIGIVLWKTNWKPTGRSKRKNLALMLRTESKKSPIKLSPSDILSATNGFSKSRIIGQGRTATVYR